MEAQVRRGGWAGGFDGLGEVSVIPRRAAGLGEFSLCGRFSGLEVGWKILGIPGWWVDP